MAKKRVINSETRSTSATPFIPDSKILNGLNLGSLTEVTVGEAVITDKSPMELFRGMTIPTINFVFKGTAKGGKQQLYVNSFMAWDTTDDSKDGMAWDSISATVKHFAEVLKREAIGEELNDLDYKLLQLGDATDAEGICKDFKSFFTNIATLFNGGTVNKHKYPSLLVKDDKPIKLWIKLLLYTESKKKGRVEVNKGAPGMPFYPGEGLIEVYVKGVEPTLRINISKGESIIPVAKVTNRAVAGNPMGNAGSSPSPGVGSGDANNGSDEIADWMKE